MTKSTVDVTERNLISNALGLQVASFKRALNAAVQSKDAELQDFYERKLQLTNNLIARMSNMELPL